MINKSFFPNKIFFILLFLVIFGILNLGFNLWLISVPALVLIFLTRKKEIQFKETSKTKGDLFLSPIYGKVVSVSKTPIEYVVIIKMNFWKSWGLYLPFSSEMSYLNREKGERYYNNEDYKNLSSIFRTEVELVSKRSKKCKLFFPKRINDRNPILWMKSGDRGRGAACFGYYPFGGLIVIFLPAETEILVVEGENIQAGFSVIGVIPYDGEV
jgi:hypothetical protein